MNQLKIKKLHPDAMIPTRSHPHDAGLDLYALEDTRIHNGTVVLVKTGIAIDIPEGYEAQVRPRSGMTLKTPLQVQLGTIDCGYAGDVGVIVRSFKKPSGGDLVYRPTDYFEDIEAGDKIAQLVISPIVTPSVEIVEEFESESARGTNGFGSTGK
ncbi:dUTP diphosphatase [Salinicoccus carnicancri]|uniref:dUTP diphosphatase n=1 Tax=Salinicoccus carnicancri TaxID=558170 RepID=UPI00035DCF27|nr:dUTP diphosphatase [Salinicoccus carnicancri]